mgnify:CR=1 FL=1
MAITMAMGCGEAMEMRRGGEGELGDGDREEGGGSHLEPKHLHAPLRQPVHNLEARGCGIREDGSDPAAVRSPHIRFGIERDCVLDLEQLPRQRVGLVIAQRFEEAGKERRAAHLARVRVRVRGKGWIRVSCYCPAV